ncbi:MAG: GNAT family N-acetyltransferase [Rubrobacteraceae bacterium]
MGEGFLDKETGSLIRSMEDSDLDRVKELRSAVGWAADPRGFGVLWGIRDARWAVAERRDGGLTGMVGTMPLGEVGILCQLAVREEYRRLGLGTKLVSWAVAYLRSRGVRVVRLYSTRRAEKIYHATGFRAVSHRIIYRRETPDSGARTRDGGDGRYSIEALTAGDLSEVYGADLWSYGADRSALILATLRLHSGGGLVARDSGGQLKGYLIRSTTPRATRLGPILAEGPEVARLLIARALESCATPIEATVTGPKGAAAHGLFEEFGFEGREDRLRMELGTTPMKPRGSLEDYATTSYLAT